MSKTKVYPSKREVKGECPLVIFDLPYVTFYYNQVVLRYKGGDFEERVKKLKEGLGLALVHFYPLSGRLGSDEEVVLLVENCCADYTGVGVIEAVAIDVGVDELLANPPEIGAGLVQNAIDSQVEKAITGRSEEWAASPKLFQYKDAGNNCAAVGSSTRFRVYEVDFGFGPPERVRSGINNKFDGMVFLYPEEDGGKSVDVEISMNPKVLEVLGDGH